MLAEHAEAVHAEFINQEEHFRHVFRDFFLKFTDDLENIVVSEDSVHSDDNFSHDYKNIFLHFNIYRTEEFFVLDADWL